MLRCFSKLKSFYCIQLSHSLYAIALLLEIKFHSKSLDKLVCNEIIARHSVFFVILLNCELIEEIARSCCISG